MSAGNRKRGGWGQRRPDEGKKWVGIGKGGWGGLDRIDQWTVSV
jgi:hypothetical protein